jgi:hypothetical protein
MSSISNGGTLTLPTSTDTLVGRATTDTLTNKTLTAPVISTIVNGGTLTLPTSTDTLVGRATTDPTINSPTISSASFTGTVTIPGGIKTSGPNPSVTDCGDGGALAAGSTDTAGRLTIGTAAGGACAVYFASAKTSAPFCVLANQTSGAKNPVYTVSNLSISITTDVLDEDVISYICVQH